MTRTKRSVTQQLRSAALIVVALTYLSCTSTITTNSHKSLILPGAHASTFSSRLKGRSFIGRRRNKDKVVKEEEEPKKEEEVVETQEEEQPVEETIVEVETKEETNEVVEKETNETVEEEGEESATPILESNVDESTTVEEEQIEEDAPTTDEETSTSTTILEENNDEISQIRPMIPEGKRLTETSMSQTLRSMEYAVRGKVVIAADKITAQLKKHKEESSDGDDVEDPYPFSHIVYTNIGNPQSVGQQPLTWPRQVLALADLPDEMGVDHPQAESFFPSDAIARARVIKDALDGYGTGAYTHSQGPLEFRKDICRFIEERDGLESGSCDVDMIFMTNGASAAIEMVLTTLIGCEKCGVMVPIPQYPIYSATIDLLGGQKVGYYLDESNGWDLNLKELERSLKEARDQGIIVNSFVLINPGNPTGQVLTKKAIQDIVQFCAKHKLVLLADEVYQENVYTENGEFYSCKKAAIETGLTKKDAIELVSFHSTSKGLFGECGRRGGYMELQGFDPAVKDHIYKLASSGLCSNTPGQIMTSLMVNGPKEGDTSFESHEAEKKAVFEGLKRRAKIASEGFNNILGFSCQEAAGAMYCFPKVTLPEKAIQKAEEDGIAPDTMYAVSLLESTGICVVPASGFGQEEGRFGFRTTFLPSEEEMVEVVKAVGRHHEEFCARYSDGENNVSEA